MSISSGLSCHPWKTRIDLPREKPARAPNPREPKGLWGPGPLPPKSTLPGPGRRPGKRRRGCDKATRQSPRRSPRIQTSNHVNGLEDQDTPEVKLPKTSTRVHEADACEDRQKGCETGGKIYYS